MILARPDLIAPPVLERRAEIPSGVVFQHGGRLLKVVHVHGTDPAAPVIVEELIDGPTWLQGQLALWSADGVARALRNPLFPSNRGD